MPARSSDKGTPIPEKIEEARRAGSLETDVAWIKKSIEEGHVCISEARISALEKGTIFGRGLAVTTIFFVLGTLVTAFVSCQQQTEQNAETRTMVHANTTSISKLEKSIDRVNDARAADAKAIIEAVKRNNGPSTRESGVRCSDLDARQKRALRKALGREYPCD